MHAAFTRQAAMKFPLPADMFPPVVLTSEDEQMLEEAAEAVVKRTVDEYNEHLMTHNGVVDERRWKKIKQRDDMRVYRERIPDLDNDALDPDGFRVLAPMLGFGSVEGSLEDVMYGVTSPSTEAMQLKSAYVENGFVDWALLASIIAPSEREPFRELSLKWYAKGNPPLVGAIIRMRDVVCIDSSGFAQTPNGERIGYHLDHSVSVPGVPELTELSVVRAKVSFCYIFRERSLHCVEVFIRGVIVPMGDTTGPLIAATAAEAAVAVWKNSYHGEMKKLSRVLGSLHPGVTPYLSSSSSTSSGAGWIDSSVSSDGGTDCPSSSSSSARAADSCGRCSKSLASKKFALPGSSSKREKKSCAKTLKLPSTAKPKELTTAATTVCTLCVKRIANSSSNAFAVLDARKARGECVDYTAALVEA